MFPSWDKPAQKADRVQLLQADRVAEPHTFKLEKNEQGFNDVASLIGSYIKLARKKQNIGPMWKVLNKEVELGEPTSFLDHVYLGCTQRQCQISKDIVDNYRTMFESRIPRESGEITIPSKSSYFFMVL